MNPWRSLRVRLTAGFLLLALTALSIGAAAMVLLVEQSSLGTLDTVLHEEALTIAALADLPREQLAAIVNDIGSEPDLGPEKFLHVRAGDGTVIAASGTVPEAALRHRPLVDGEGDVTTVRTDDAVFRVAWAPAHGGVVMVGAPAAGELAFVTHARWGISLVSAALLGLLVAGAWVITGRAMHELDRLAHEVTTLEAGALDRRLSQRHTTEVDRLVEVLNRLLERLERSVGELRRFTADAAHELRTPIAAMRARLEVALYRENPAVPREVVVDVLEQLDHLRRLAEDMLTLARVEGGAVRTDLMEADVDVTRLVEEVGSAMSVIADEQGRSFRWDAAPALRVRGSEPLLKRVLLNLVDNAFRHTPASAPVTVHAERTDGRVVVDVVDHGPGVDPAVLPHAFERFRHGRGGGSGLGLALVREIVERHGGTVTLEQRAPHGARVRVVLGLS